MQIVIHQNNNIKVAEIISEKIIINKVKDALDLMVNVDYLGSRQIILHSNNITPDFFRLKTGLAGEILQKFVNYKIKMAIIGDFTIYESNSLQAFIKECNRSGQFFFLNDIETAKAKLFHHK
jgi:hypothetical protein